MMDICKDVRQPDHVYMGRNLLFLDVSDAYPGLFDIQ
jgi:hypothetical protein